MRCYFSLIVLLASFTSLAAQELYFPPDHSTGIWESTDPAALGYCQDQIDELYQYLDDNLSKSFILLKDGKIVLENYFGDFIQDSLFVWNSAGKSLRSVMVGIAQEQGFLNINNQTNDYLGDGWTSLTQEQEDSIDVWHQITMTTGLAGISFDCTDPSCLNYFTEPGTRWLYHNGPYSLTKEVLEATTGQTLNQLTNQWIEEPLGMGLSFWFSFGDNTVYLSRARDMARFGLMVQAGGVWDDITVLGDQEYLTAMTQPSQDINPAYGYLWWLNGTDSYIPPGALFSRQGPIAPAAPADAYIAAGKDGQFISISPATGLIMVRQGNFNDNTFAALEFHNGIWERINALECNPDAVLETALPELSIYPNPLRNRVWVKNLPANGADLRIFNAAGQQLRARQNARTLSLIGLPAGEYFLQVQLDGAQRTFPLLKF